MTVIMKMLNIQLTSEIILNNTIIAKTKFCNFKFMFIDFLLYNFGFYKIIKSILCYHEEISRSFGAAKICRL